MINKGEGGWFRRLIDDSSMLRWREPRTILAALCLLLLAVVAIESLVATVLRRKEDKVIHNKYHGYEWQQGLLQDYVGRPREVRSKYGVVASDQGDCSEVGAEALRAGGHAADAAVATALCLGVKNPFASGIGGGAFILVHTKAGIANDQNEYSKKLRTYALPAHWRSQEDSALSKKEIHALAGAAVCSGRGGRRDTQC